MQSPPPRVSIGLPVYNGENYLAAAVESLLAQTYTDFELIICDNSSTDRTEAICRRFAEADSRIRYYRNARNIGASANFNLTFELSIGEYFKWAAHDDIHAPTYLERCVAALDAEPDAVLAQPLVGVIDEHGALLSIEDNDLQRASVARPSERFAAMARHPRHCWEAFGLVRRDAMAKTALLAPYSCADVALCTELALLGRFVLVPEPLFLNRDHPARFSHAVLVDREACWRWWCNAEGRARLIDLCPHWQIQLEFLRMIRKHVSGRRERYATYFRLLQHVATRYTLSRLIVEPLTAADPRILAAGRRVKRWLSFDKQPDLPATAARVGRE